MDSTRRDSFYLNRREKTNGRGNSHDVEEDGWFQQLGGGYNSAEAAELNLTPTFGKGGTSMRLVIAILLSTMLANVSLATLSTYSTWAGIPSPNPHSVSNGEQLILHADFDSPFTAIEAPTLILVFDVDLWDPGETIAVFFPGPGGDVGVTNTASVPYEPRSWTLSLGWESVSNALLTGSLDFSVQSINGSVAVDACAIYLLGEVIPEPSTLILLISGIAALTLRNRQTITCRLSASIRTWTVKSLNFITDHTNR